MFGFVSHQQTHRNHENVVYLVDEEQMYTRMKER